MATSHPERATPSLTRSVGAVGIGYALLGGALAAKFWLIQRFVPQLLPAPGDEVFPNTGWLIAFLVSDIALMIVAGYVTARVSRRAHIVHSVVLGAVMVILGLTWMFVFWDWLPLWYQVVLVSVAIPAAATGGSLRRPHAEHRVVGWSQSGRPR